MVNVSITDGLDGSLADFELDGVELDPSSISFGDILNVLEIAAGQARYKQRTTKAKPVVPPKFLVAGSW